MNDSKKKELIQKNRANKKYSIQEVWLFDTRLIFIVEEGAALSLGAGFVWSMATDTD